MAVSPSAMSSLINGWSTTRTWWPRSTRRSSARSAAGSERKSRSTTMRYDASGLPSLRIGGPLPSVRRPSGPSGPSGRVVGTGATVFAPDWKPHNVVRAAYSMS